MSTSLFNSIIFGPVHSRRLGLSLGVNLLPAFGKWCSFDCIYCECGWNKDGIADRKLPNKEDVVKSLETALSSRLHETPELNTITFSGNGEPTMHPDFAEIIEMAINLRDKYTPSAKISVLTNGSQIGKKAIVDALLKVDNAIIKLDSAFDETAVSIDRPQYMYSVSEVIKNLQPFKNRFVLQTMFLTGEFEGKIFDNTTDKELAAWYKVIDMVSPREVMIYTIDRDTPAKNLNKISQEVLNKIATPLVKKGYKVIVAG